VNPKRLKLRRVECNSALYTAAVVRVILALGEEFAKSPVKRQVGLQGCEQIFRVPLGQVADSSEKRITDTGVRFRGLN